MEPPEDLVRAFRHLEMAYRSDEAERIEYWSYQVQLAVLRCLLRIHNPEPSRAVPPGPAGLLAFSPKTEFP